MHGTIHCGRNNIILSSPPLRLQNGRASFEIRVVFDAFCRSSSSVSLNDTLLVGPTVQQDLISILMRFRFFTYVITADNIKMYWQILMHPSQTRLQRILWRNNPSANVDTYELTTITYGTASTSFLATGCLKHLTEQHAPQFTRGSACVLRDFYVDAHRSRYNRRIETNSR